MATIGYILSFLVVTGVVLIFMYIVRRSRRVSVPPTATEPAATAPTINLILTGAVMGLAAGVVAVLLFAFGMLWGGPFVPLGVGAVIVAVAGLTVAYTALMRNRDR